MKATGKEYKVFDDEGNMTFEEVGPCEIEIKIVQDNEIACPECGAYSGHPDPKLNFPNRFKVDDFCKCCNPKCKVSYYNPYTKEVEYDN